jgi:hypothetical protein
MDYTTSDNKWQGDYGRQTERNLDAVVMYFEVDYQLENQEANGLQGFPIKNSQVLGLLRCNFNCSFN